MDSPNSSQTSPCSKRSHNVSGSLKGSAELQYRFTDYSKSHIHKYLTKAAYVYSVIVLAFNRNFDLNWSQVVTLRHRLITAAQETDVVTKVGAYSFCMQ